MRQNNPVVEDAEKIKEIVIHTSHHTHNVIGSGANDPQKYDPKASRETLDHSIPYIFTVALQDGSWHHEHSYHPDRANRPDTVALWQRVVTERALITLKNQGTLQSEVSGMQTRSRLYELLDYEKYQDFDNSVFNFTLNKDQ